MSNVSAFKRLSSVPEVFTGGDLTMLFGWTSPTASTYLANWRKAGWVKSLGGRSDVHMNLAVNRHVNPERALQRVFPMATLVGADLLREAGWTTQIVNTPEVATPQSGPLYAVEGFHLTVRADKWFGKTAPGTLYPQGGMARLRPAWAWADMIARVLDKRVRNAWLLAPDDLDFTLIEEDITLTDALAAFGIPETLGTEAGYSQLYDTFDALQHSRH